MGRQHRGDGQDTGEDTRPGERAPDTPEGAAQDERERAETREAASGRARDAARAELERIADFSLRLLEQQAEQARAARARGTTGAGSASHGGTPAEVPVEEPLDDVEVLTTLARLDREAAQAYAVAAESSTDIPLLRTHLLEYREAHLQQVDTLGTLLRARGASPVERGTAPAGGLLRGVARLTSPFGPSAAVLAVLMSAQLANLAYELALEFAWDEETAGLLERHATRIQQHLEWLSDLEDAIEREEPSFPTSVT